MTVKIVKQPKAKRVTCDECGAVLEYRPGDVKARDYTACGSPETGSFIDCPACGSWVEVTP